MKIPKVGNIIYLRTELYLSHGEDDVLGGKATVAKVEFRYGILWVKTHEVPSFEYGWEALERHQKALKKEFKDQWAKPIPDFRAEFNRWD